MFIDIDSEDFVEMKSSSSKDKGRNGIEKKGVFFHQVCDKKHIGDGILRLAK